MNAEETETYQYQLEQVELALSKDPDNEELKKLQHDLKELIALTEQLEQQQKQQTKKDNTSSTHTNVSASSTPTATALKTQQFSVGQDVMARWSGDGQFYRATITAIGGADQVFSVVFRGYQDNELVKAEDIKAIDSKKRVGIFEDVAVDNKKKVKKEKPAPQKKKVSEVEVKKNAWLNFATTAESKKKSKKIVATPINKKSIFKTPDNPESKVGVVGSGRGMTSYQQRGKHIYAGASTADDD